MTAAIQIKPNIMAKAMPYRADIDGMRAVAVLSVVLFHFRESFFANGYLGVDIFFVLSGYLITSIIVRELDKGEYTLRGFYERRIRRIMPALLLVLAFTTCAAAYILLPSDLAGYGKSLAATIGFVSNIYFWRDTNYFAPDAVTKPLLHMWSLAVEEQFYIFYPVLLTLIMRFARRFAFWILLSLCLLSLALNMALNHIGGGSPAFFMFPTRAWQLLAGACLVTANIPQLGKGISHCVSVTGAGLLAAGFLLPTADYFGDTPVGLPVVLGAVMLIVSGTSHGSFFNRILEMAPFVSVGKISYSLYLWHWPIVVFWQYYGVKPLSVIQIIAAFILMMLLAYASTHYIEKPTRHKSFAIRKLIICVGALTVIILATA